jgi:hypothetical protein
MPGAQDPDLDVQSKKAALSPPAFDYSPLLGFVTCIYPESRLNEMDFTQDVLPSFFWPLCFFVSVFRPRKKSEVANPCPVQD